MTTWTSISDRLKWFMEEVPGTNSEWKEYARIDAWNMAQDVFSAHTAMEKTYRTVVELISVPDPITTNNPVAQSPYIGWLLLPPDFMAMAQVYDWALRKVLTPYQTRAGEMRVMQVPIQYWVWGSKVTIEGTPTPSSLDISYYAFWPRVTYRYDKAGSLEMENQDILVPQWAELPLLHLTVAVLLQPKAIQSAMIREYNIKIDSGTPDDNARRTQAKVHWDWYNYLLSVRPAQSRLAGMNSGPNR